MIKFNHTHISSIIVMTIIFAASVMMNSGCSNEPILTESVMDETLPLDTEYAPDIAPNQDIAPATDNSSETIEVEAGEKFTISLQSNPTTGYNWDPEFDSEFLILVESNFIPPSSELIGAGGVETFVFQALKPGQVEVAMKYQRPWEDQPIEEQSRKVNIAAADIAAADDNIADADDQMSILNGTAGETITISLISNPTTGFMWQPEFDSEMLELVNRDYVSDSTKPGSPGMETFEFLMLKQGEARVKMLYKRPWENEILDEHVTMININPAN